MRTRMTSNTDTFNAVYWLLKTFAKDSITNVWQGPKYTAAYFIALPFLYLKIHRKAPVLESLFNEVTGLEVLELYLKRDTNAGVFLWISKFLRTPFLQNITGRLHPLNQQSFNLLCKSVDLFLSDGNIALWAKLDSSRPLVVLGAFFSKTKIVDIFNFASLKYFG